MKLLSRAIIVLGALTILAMGLYPPWTATARWKDETLAIKSAGYHFVLESPGRDVDNSFLLFGVKPEDESSRFNSVSAKDLREHVTYEINMPRLLIQWVVAILLTVGLLWVSFGRSRIAATQD